MCFTYGCVGDDEPSTGQDSDGTPDDDAGDDDDSANDDSDDDAGDDDTWPPLPDDDAATDDDEPPYWPACDETAATQTLTFVHINDIHANYTPAPPLDEYLKTDPSRDYVSPVSRLIGYYKQVKAENPYTVLTNGGDDFEKGSVAELISNGRSTTEVTFALGFDVRVIGNHDFCWGEEETLDYSNDPKSIVIASNTTYTGDSAKGFGAVPYAEIEVGCVTVGFFGMQPRPFDETDTQYTGNYLPNFETRYDYANVAAEIVAEHRDDVDLLVMISHLGVGDDIAVAEQVNGIDLVLGGHSHTVIYPEIVTNDTIIVQAGSSADYAARLDLDIDLTTRQIVDRAYHMQINIPFVLPVDEETEDAIEGIMATWAPEAMRHIAYVRDPRWQDGVAGIAARAAIDVLDVDAALIEHDNMWSVDPYPTWMRGGLTPQAIYNVFKVQREPAGTPGFTAFYTVEVSGSELESIRDGMGEGWTFLGPDPIVPANTYTLALNKRSALHPDSHLPPGVTVANAAFASEIWAAVDEYARQRTGECKYVDSDGALPDCP
ncbi:MAG: metallophosphatase [Deltaproteobacteria bacterium]|nr:metallophosphatase [Deltaproteobacteria bacterium]